MVVFFFFKAEDGIRARNVTGVQTCALPISECSRRARHEKGDCAVKRFDISVVGELNADLILYGLPATLEPEREHLAENFAITLGSSSAIFAHNISLLGSRVGFTSCIGGDPLGNFCVDRLQESC